MTLFEGLLLVNLSISVWVGYKVGTIESDIETLYEGLAMTMEHTGFAAKE
tara:strand:+ start:382 stop:531 length:150 start_codon:yes stop_codon:yes gene_type:complete